MYVQWVAGSATAAADALAEAEADADADGEADVVALGFFAAAGVLPPVNTTVRRGEAEDADNGEANAEPLTDLALPFELYLPLPLVPFPGAPPVSFSAPRQGCRLLYIAISPQRTVRALAHDRSRIVPASRAETELSL